MMTCRWSGGVGRCSYYSPAAFACVLPASRFRSHRDARICNLKGHPQPSHDYTGLYAAPTRIEWVYPSLGISQLHSGPHPQVHMAPLPSMAVVNVEAEDAENEHRAHLPRIVDAPVKIVDLIRTIETSTTAQNYRRDQLRNKNLLVIQGGWFAGKRHIFERLNSLGVNITMIDTLHKYNWLTLVDEGVIKKFIEVDVDDHVNLFERCIAAIRDATNPSDFHGCCTYYEEALCLCGRVAEELGLGFNPAQAYENSRNKRRTREVMANVGLPTPRFCKIRSADDLKQAIELVGFPAVLKPTLGSGSWGVVPVHNEEDVYTKYRTVVGLMVPEIDSAYKHDTEVLMEEFYDGDEFDIDVLLHEGEVVYSKVSDNWPCAPPYFKESGTNCPSVFPAEKQEELVKVSTDTIFALGYKNGVFHVEAKYTSSGARIIEVNARMGGYAVRDVNLYAWGIDLIEEQAMAALKIGGKPIIPEKPLSFIAEVGLSAPYTGQVNQDKWLDYIKADKRIIQVNYWRKKGEKATGPEDRLPSVVAEILAVSTKSVEEACQVIRDVVRNIGEPPITPKRAGVMEKFHFSEDGHPFNTFQLETKPSTN